MVTFAVEKFSEVYGELLSLLDEHYREISTHVHHGVPLDPIVSDYEAREKNGSFMVVIGREQGRIVAYFWAFIAPALHYKSCLTCSPDIFYVEQSRRTGMLGIKMFRFVEQELKRRGVQRWAVGTKVKHDASALFEYLKFEPVEKTYEKWL